MSNKYIESMNKITMDDEMKKRIFEKVSQVSEEEINNNNISKRYGRVNRKFVGVAVACCAFVVCAGLKVKFPELFNSNNINSSNEIMVDSSSEISDNNILENTDTYQTSDNNENSSNTDNDINNSNSSVNNSASVDYNLETKNEEFSSNNVVRENKRESNIIKSNKSNDESGTEKITKSSAHKEVTDMGSQNNEKVEADNSENKTIINNYEKNNNYKEEASTNNEPTVISENNHGKEYSQNDITKNVDSEINNVNDISSSTKKVKGGAENIENNFIIPKALKNNYEITNMDSSDLIKVVYKDKEYGDGELIISAKEIANNNENFSSIEDVETSEGNAVIKISEDGKEKYIDWKYENKYYSLNTEGKVDNEEIINIIESCR